MERLEKPIRIVTVDVMSGETITGTIVLIEADPEMGEGFEWLYVVADDERFNTNFEPSLNQNIWGMLTSSDEYEVLSEE